MQRRERRIQPVFILVGVLATTAASAIVACGSSDDSSSMGTSDASVGDSTTVVGDTGDNVFDGGLRDSEPLDSGASDGATNDAGSNDGDAGNLGDALIDPIPTACDAGGVPPVVGGTLACPSDKNLEGCPCPYDGATAACWPGERVNRDHGDCKDGNTRCGSDGGALVWGPCDGAVLPSGTTGLAACTCLSQGRVTLTNSEPCLVSGSDGGAEAISTLASTGRCPTDFSAAPTEAWSTATLTADCAGEWTVCYTIKAGDPMHPLASDCTIIQDCTTAHYPGGNTAVAFPPLPGWLAPPSAEACVAQLEATGGYGEYSINGQSDLCELEGDVFGIQTYCPVACNGPNPPASCAQCMSGGGMF